MQNQSTLAAPSPRRRAAGSRRTAQLRDTSDFRTWPAPRKARLFFESSLMTSWRSLNAWRSGMAKAGTAEDANNRNGQPARKILEMVGLRPLADGVHDQL